MRSNLCTSSLDVSRPSVPVVAVVIEEMVMVGAFRRVHTEEQEVPVEFMTSHCRMSWLSS
ncbi:hypothetical protein D3C84_1115420 [compost metagenome]